MRFFDNENGSRPGSGLGMGFGKKRGMKKRGRRPGRNGHCRGPQHGRHGRGPGSGRSGITMNQMKAGEIGRIADLEGGNGYRGKLMAMGLVPGKTVECVRRSGPSVICVRVNDSEFFVNSTMAEHIGIVPA